MCQLVLLYYGGKHDMIPKTGDGVFCSHHEW